MILDDNRDSVADQMWEVVSSVISYSSDLMNGLFATVGAQQDEVSPFFRNFSFLFSFGPASNVPKLTHYGVV